MGKKWALQSQVLATRTANSSKLCHDHKTITFVTIVRNLVKIIPLHASWNLVNIYKKLQCFGFIIGKPGQCIATEPLADCISAWSNIYLSSID